MNNCFFCGKETSNTAYCSLSCSNTARTPKNEAKYNLNPKRCPFCNKAITYSKRHGNTFCSHSCAAKATNHKRPRKLKPEKVGSHHSRAVKRFALGHVSKRATIRAILIETRGNKCAICGIPAVWCEKPLTLIVDHEDGNAGNNLPDNVRLICPNCSSQTPTFCGRNIGNGRQSRGLSKYA
jgi:hypothetical protein